jgi:small GTP-binding protein
MTASKLMLLGEIGVGKSSIVNRLVFDRFELDYKPTIGVDVYRYVVPDTPQRRGVTLIIWDTDGNFGNSLFKHIYMKEAQAAVIVSDLTRPQSVEAMLKLGDGFDAAFPGRHVEFVLNKSDLGESIDVDRLNAMVRASQRSAIITSALTGSGVVSAFTSAADAICRRRQN